MTLFTKLREHCYEPTRGSNSSAGYDLYADTDYNIHCDDVVKISTGYGVIMPQGHCGLIVGRSSLGSRGVIVHGGLIDADYRGEIMVLLSSLHTYQIKAGDRVAQLVILPCFMPGIVEQDRLGGLGSTGR